MKKTTLAILIAITGLSAQAFADAYPATVNVFNNTQDTIYARPDSYSTDIFNNGRKFSCKASAPALPTFLCATPSTSDLMVLPGQEKSFTIHSTFVGTAAPFPQGAIGVQIDSSSMGNEESNIELPIQVYPQAVILEQETVDSIHGQFALGASDQTLQGQPIRYATSVNYTQTSADPIVTIVVNLYPTISAKPN